jgi:branched-chain amino acid transport system permease protein
VSSRIGAIARRLPPTGVLIAGALVLATIIGAPLLTGYQRYLLEIVLVYFVATSGYTVLVGSSGQFAFSQGAFFAGGVYILSVLSGPKHQLPIVISVLAVLLATVVVGYVLALLCVRMAGIYLAFGTLSFQFTVTWALVAFESETQGSRGITVPPLSFFGFDVDSDLKLLYTVLAVACVLALLLRNLLRSATGRAWLTLKSSEPAARAAGIPVRHLRALAFAISAVTAGIAGVLYGETSGYVTPDDFGLGLSIAFFAIIVLGGLGSLPGALIGSLVVVIVPEVLRPLHQFRQLFYGLVIVVSILFLPGGLTGLVGVATRIMRWRPPGRSQAPTEATG